MLQHIFLGPSLGSQLEVLDPKPEYSEFKLILLTYTLKMVVSFTKVENTISFACLIR
jgi:hypothetical protein